MYGRDGRASWGRDPRRGRNVDRGRVADVVFADRGEARLPRGAPPPARRRRVPAVARAARRAAGPAARLRDRGAAPLRGGRRERGSTRSSSSRRPRSCATSAAPRAPRRPREPSPPRRGEGRSGPTSRTSTPARSMDLDALVAGRDGGADGPRDEARSSSAARVALAAFGLYVYETEPAWYERLRYPLRLRGDRPRPRGEYELDPQLLAAVIYQESKFDADARSTSGAVGLDAAAAGDRARGSPIAPAATAGGPRTSRTRSSTSATAPGTSPPARQVRRRGLALAAYNAGQRNVDDWRERGVGIQFPETQHYVERSPS